VSASAPAGSPAPSVEKLESYFRIAAFIVLAVVGAIATLQTYISLQSVIGYWLQPQWVGVAQSVFSLAILAIVVWLIRAFVIGRRA
jgi:hypothetical protein